MKTKANKDYMSWPTMSDIDQDPNLQLTQKQRAYIEFLVNGGFKLEIVITSDGPPAPWNVEGQEIDGVPEFEIPSMLKGAAEQAVRRGDRAIFKLKQAESDMTRAVLHGSRLVVKSVQTKLKEKLNYWKEQGGPMSAIRIATTEAFLNEMVRDFQDLSKILDEEESKIRSNIEPLNP